MTIPAGKQYITFSPGDSVYIIDGTGAWPTSLRERMGKMEADAYMKGFKEGQEFSESNTAAAPINKETNCHKIKQLLEQVNVRDQNEIVAVILEGLTRDRKERAKALQQDVDRAQSLLQATYNSLEGLQAIRQGGFESLNIR